MLQGPADGFQLSGCSGGSLHQVRPPEQQPHVGHQGEAPEVAIKGITEFRTGGEVLQGIGSEPGFERLQPTRLGVFRRPGDVHQENVVGAVAEQQAAHRQVRHRLRFQGASGHAQGNAGVLTVERLHQLSRGIGEGSGHQNGHRLRRRLGPERHAQEQAAQQAAQRHETSAAADHGDSIAPSCSLAQWSTLS